MIKNLIIFITSLFFVIAAAPWENPAAYIQRTNVDINNSCSGTIIDNEQKLILTAAHCFGNDGPISVSQYQGSVMWTAPAKIVKVDPGPDLALIQLQEIDLIPHTAEAELDYSPLVMGDDVFAVGNPLLSNNILTKGIVSNPVNINGEGTSDNAFVTDVTTLPGSSGGGVYNAKGKLIGVVSGGYARMGIPAGLNFIVSPSAIEEFLKEKEDQ